MLLLLVLTIDLLSCINQNLTHIKTQLCIVAFSACYKFQKLAADVIYKNFGWPNERIFIVQYKVNRFINEQTINSIFYSDSLCKLLWVKNNARKAG